jgi:hypothetical protein
MVLTNLGLGPAGYGPFLSRIHFSGGGWVGLVLAIIGIVGVGSLIKKSKEKAE